ncbi:RNA polymerase II-associated [Phellopilus nigrolimitatus]|nr:RNA polymerase II-associated [Phellopilus nigrolimitatus]
MSVKKNKLDLLFKVRYQNPLPAPPFPPKLLNIPTNPSRYAGPEFTASLASETPLPMVVDAELGMPLDLSFFDCLWEEGVDDSQLNPDPNNAPAVDPKDAFMLGDSLLSSVNGNYSSGTAPSTPQVPWLRKTEYISSTVSRTPTSSHDPRRANEDSAVVDISRAAQIKAVEASFAYAEEKFDITTLKHPNKPNVSVVESYEILPDTDIWANAYDLFRFSERPGERSTEVPDPRLDCAILRPMESDGDHFLAYYLPKEDEVAEDFIERRRNNEDVEETIFSFVRDYETVKIEQDVPNEFFLVLDDGNNDDAAPEDSSRRKGKGAYYKNIERKIVLKKKRANQWDTYTDKWDAINLSLAPFSQEELEEREEALAEVVDPLYLFARADADADGEVDDTEVNVHNGDVNDFGVEAVNGH